jgi:hypothetical protein
VYPTGTSRLTANLTAGDFGMTVNQENCVFAPKFYLGRLAITQGAANALARSAQTPCFFLQRHALGDWGGLCAEDSALNDEAVSHGCRIHSAYRTLRSERIWIITEADRSVTTILTPDEY